MKSIFKQVDTLNDILWKIRSSSTCDNITRAYNRYWGGCTDPDIQIVGKMYDRLDSYIDGFSTDMTFAEIISLVSNMMDALARVYDPDEWYDADEDYIREKLSEF